jgi:Fic family protein
MLDAQEIQRSLTSASGEFNHRQLAVLKRAVEDPDARFTAKSHQTSHRISNQTAHQDLAILEERGLLRRAKFGHQFIWQPAADLPDRLRRRD